VAVVFGLGNPGPRYHATRHNVGFRVVDVLVRRSGAVPAPATPEYRAWRGVLAGRGVDLVQPSTFMNRSGEALAAWRERHGLESESLLVVADDVYLPFGVLRLRARGSSGGHRGLESIESALGTGDYPRLRVGVGAAEDAAALREHVLETLDDDEAAQALEAEARAADAVECWIERGLLDAMNRFNRRTTKEVEEP
jgi:PTH1 family peptidyl-tRNA hydrolase